MKRGLTTAGYLKGAPYRHCFVSFPHSWLTLITPAVLPTFTIESAKHSIIVSWAGFSHDSEKGQEDSDSVIYISSKLLQVNRFSEGEYVIVRQIACPKPSMNISMSALSEADWEGLLLNSENASQEFLSQLRIVVKDQIFPLWLEGGAFIYLKVIKLPASLSIGLLQSNTQVEILPPYQMSSQHSPLAITPSKTKNEKKNEICTKLNFWTFLYALLSLFGNSRKKFSILPKQTPYIGLRAISSLPYLNSSEKNIFFDLILSHPSAILISKEYLQSTIHESSDYFIGEVSKIKSKKDVLISSLSSEEPDKVIAVVLVWENIIKKLDIDNRLILEVDSLLKHKMCILSRSLNDKFKLETKHIIIIKSCEMSLKNTKLTVDINISKVFAQLKDLIPSCMVSLLKRLSQNAPIILNNLSQIKLNVENNEIDVTLTTRDRKPIFVDESSISLLSINVEVESNSLCQNQTLLDRTSYTNKETSTNFLVHKETLEDLVRSVQKNLRFDVILPSLCPQFILLQGSKGSGKTTLVKNLVQRLTQKPFFVHCEIIELKNLKGKKVESVHKILKTAIKEAQNFQPSLIVLDDLDFLAPAPTPTEEEKGAIFEYTHYMAFMLRNLLLQLLESMKRSSKDSPLKYDCITVVATCSSRNRVHPLLSIPKGKHIFPKSFHIPLLNSEEKLNLFQSLLLEMYEKYLEHKMLALVDKKDRIFCFTKSKMLVKLEGLALSDISTLALRTFLQSQNRWKLQNLNFNKNFIIQDVEEALAGFVPLSSRGLKLPTAPKHYKKIGGLYKAREALDEMILWPSQYPKIFSQTKLRLPSGLLLYGPPGCGKTLLAQSFQNVSHLSFIGIKGPELLSKYIGQSEKSVRDAFERAQNAKPCVLFFDEFESIAPRRGHDNTGVTDRVVNQLLTQMDGVEGLSGVYIVAATSRPDLIDPALLRPGRLDKGIYCPIPNQSEREEILSVFSEEMNFETTLDAKELAQKTEGFSGADLQSLLATAQVKAVQEVIGTSLYEVALNEPQVYDSKTDGQSPSEEFITVSLDESLEFETSADFVSFNAKKTDNSSVSSNEFTKQKHEEKNVCIVIKKDHIEKALKEVQPSVSEKERLKYETLHRIFSNDGEKKVFSVVKAGKRQTLA